MLYKDYYSIVDGITLNTAKGGLFQRALAKNKAICKEEIAINRETWNPSDEYKNFESSMNDLFTKFCKKDEQGKLITREDGYILFEKDGDKNEYEDAVKKLQEDNKEIIDARASELSEFQLFLDSEVPEDKLPKWEMIEKNEIPADAGQELELIIMFLK